MKSKTVALPDAEIIELSRLTQAMIDAVHPLLDDAVGIDCVVGKTFLYENDEANLPLNFRITDAEKEQLLPLLNRLPKIFGKMSDAQIANFLEKYTALPDKLPWMPRLYSEADLHDALNTRSILRNRYNQSLQNQIYDGSLPAFDVDHVPMKRIGILGTTFISKESAVRFLKNCGLSIQSHHIQSKERPRTSAPALNQEKVVDTKVSLPRARTQAKKLKSNENPINISDSFSVHSKQNTIEKFRKSPKDLLGQAMDKYKKENPNEYEANLIYQAFHELAKNYHHPFKLNEKGTILWDHGSGKFSPLDLKHIKMRIYREDKKSKYRGVE